MVFKKMLRMLGLAAPSADTVLTDSQCRPGGTLSGEVRLVGGNSEIEIEHIELTMVIRVKQTLNDPRTTTFNKVVVARMVKLAPEQELAIPFTLAVPWETPVTMTGERQLPNVEVRLSTELSVGGSVDMQDLDPLQVVALDSQDAVLQACFGELKYLSGWLVDVKAGQLDGVRQELPFFQELSFHTDGNRDKTLKIKFRMVASPDGLTVILETETAWEEDKEPLVRFEVSHEEAIGMDWADVVRTWSGTILDGRGAKYISQADVLGEFVGDLAAGLIGVVAGEVVGELGGSELTRSQRDYVHDQEARLSNNSEFDNGQG